MRRSMNKNDLKKVKQAETEFFNKFANFRIKNENILAREIDIRGVTKDISNKNQIETFLIDPKMVNN